MASLAAAPPDGNLGVDKPADNLHLPPPGRGVGFFFGFPKYISLQSADFAENFSSVCLYSTMKVSSFVSGSALLLAVWLGVTFVNEVSPQQYPSQRRSTDATTQVAPLGKEKAHVAAVSGRR